MRNKLICARFFTSKRNDDDDILTNIFFFLFSTASNFFCLCFTVCNVTISSADIKARSGQAFGEIKSPTTLSGPAFCWYRLEAEAGERVEVQIYRIKRLGELNTETNR